MATADIVALVVRGVLGAIPVAGPILSEIATVAIPNQRMDCFAQFVVEFEKRVQLLERDRLRDRMKQPEVIDLLQDGFALAERALAFERNEHIANLFASEIL